MKLRPHPLALLPLGVLLVGCNNIGDTNPITPEKMVEMRKKEAQERANFHPQGGPPPSSPAGSTGK